MLVTSCSSDSQNADLASHVRLLVTEFSKLSTIHPLLCELLEKLSDDENIAEVAEKFKNELVDYLDKRLLQTEATVKQNTTELLADQSLDLKETMSEHSEDLKEYMKRQVDNLAACASQSLQSLHLACKSLFALISFIIIVKVV